MLLIIILLLLMLVHSTHIVHRVGCCSLLYLFYVCLYIVCESGDVCERGWRLKIIQNKKESVVF